MKDISVEALIKRINQLEEKLFRYTETQADIYTLVVDVAKTLRKIKDIVNTIKSEISGIIEELKTRLE